MTQEATHNAGSSGDHVPGQLLTLAHQAVEAYAALGEADNPADATQRSQACQKAMGELAKFLTAPPCEPRAEPAASVRELLRLRIEMQTMRFLAQRAEAAAWLLNNYGGQRLGHDPGVPSFMNRIESWSDNVEHIAQYAIDDLRLDHAPPVPVWRTQILRRALQFLVDELADGKFEDELRATHKHLPTLDEVQAALRDVDGLVRLDEEQGGSVRVSAQ